MPEKIALTDEQLSAWRGEISRAVEQDKQVSQWWDANLRAYAPSPAGDPSIYGNDINTNRDFTLVERKTRFALIGRTQTKEAKEVTRAILRLFAELPASARLSLTLDNGKEFAGHETIAKRLGMDVFFAHPYHSWERGTNENVNGLIRRQYPKGSSFAEIDGLQVWQLRRFVNDRARDCLDWSTPCEEATACLGFAP